MIDRAGYPLSGSAARLSALDARTGFRCQVPEGPSWRSLRDIASAEVVDGCLDALPGTRIGMRNVAAAQFAASLACSVVRPLMALLHIEHRVPALRAEDSYLRIQRGRCQALALGAPAIHCLPSDPAARHPLSRIVSDTDELDALAAAALHGVLAPILDTLRSQGRYGLPRLWGAVLDMIGATSLLVARIGGLDQQQTWYRAKRLCALVQELAEQPRACRPRPFPVSWSGGEALYTVKGTCCLQYREFGLRAGEAQDAGAYCKTCPFVADSMRQAECRDQLERDMAQAG